MSSEEFYWRVVPICDAQRLDIHEDDLLNDGVFRKCNTYKSGGGYDQFPKIYNKRFGHHPNPTQFVVQLYGCVLNCKYCYVTTEGIWGCPKKITTQELLDYYNASGLETFHLMGGAPAMYLKHWKKIHDKVDIFHSDFLLVEGVYEPEWLEGLKGLHVVNFKDFVEYTEQHLQNLDHIVDAGIEFYITFTGKPTMRQQIIDRYGRNILKDSFVIDINYSYKALQDEAHGNVNNN